MPPVAVQTGIQQEISFISVASFLKNLLSLERLSRILRQSSPIEQHDHSLLVRNCALFPVAWQFPRFIDRQQNAFPSVVLSRVRIRAAFIRAAKAFQFPKPWGVTFRRHARHITIFAIGHKLTILKLNFLHALSLFDNFFFKFADRFFDSCYFLCRIAEFTFFSRHVTIRERNFSSKSSNFSLFSNTCLVCSNDTAFQNFSFAVFQTQWSLLHHQRWWKHQAHASPYCLKVHLKLFASLFNFKNVSLY